MIFVIPMIPTIPYLWIDHRQDVLPQILSQKVSSVTHINVALVFSSQVSDKSNKSE
jgi:hypothetical protein